MNLRPSLENPFIEYNESEISEKLEVLDFNGSFRVTKFRAEDFGLIPRKGEQRESFELIDPFEELIDRIDSDFLPHILNDILSKANSHLSSARPSEIDDEITFGDIHPVLSFPPNFTTPREISPVLDQKFLATQFPKGFKGDIYILSYQHSPSKIWIIGLGEPENAYLGLEIGPSDYAVYGDTTYRQYAYYSGTFFSLEKYEVIDNRSGRMVKMIKRALARKEEDKEKDVSYEFKDGLLPEVSFAEDDMNRKRENYSDEAWAFMKAMYSSDKFMREQIREDNCSQITDVTDALRRFSLRRSRGEVMRNIGDLRTLFSDYIGQIDSEPPFKFLPQERDLSEKELMERLECNGSEELKVFISDVIFDLGLSSEYHGEGFVGTTDVIKALITLLKVERSYFSAVMQYPWNSIGEEPFDALINVFWFRYNFGEIAKEHEAKKNWIQLYKEARKQIYRNAVRNRKLLFILENRINPGWEKIFSREEDIPLTKEDREELKKMGPLSRFVDSIDRGIANDIGKHIQTAVRVPSGLTLLLWKSLKWAQPSSWKMGSSSFEWKGPLWEERVVNPIDRRRTDLQMRITLAGEALENIKLKQLAHEEDKDVRYSLVARVLRAAEQEGREITIEKAREIVNGMLKEEVEKEGDRREPTRHFYQSLQKYTLEELVSKLAKLPILVQELVFHRLGFSYSKELGLKKEMNVEEVIVNVFGRSESKYYIVLNLVAQYLEGNIGAIREIKKIINSRNAEKHDFTYREVPTEGRINAENRISANIDDEIPF